MAPNYNFYGRELLIGPSSVRIERFHLAEGVYLGSDFGASTPSNAVLGILRASAWELFGQENRELEETRLICLWLIKLRSPDNISKI